jgi:hypothetical protein
MLSFLNIRDRGLGTEGNHLSNVDCLTVKAYDSWDYLRAVNVPDIFGLSQN